MGEGACCLAHGNQNGASHDQAFAQFLQGGIGLIELRLMIGTGAALPATTRSSSPSSRPACR